MGCVSCPRSAYLTAVGPRVVAGFTCCTTTLSPASAVALVNVELSATTEAARTYRKQSQNQNQSTSGKTDLPTHARRREAGRTNCGAALREGRNSPIKTKEKEDNRMQI